ncbi:MAG: tetratricopeptide repeat protein [Pseudomonadota bacterium]
MTKVLFFLLCLTLTACSGVWRKDNEMKKEDLLGEESFMRYNLGKMASLTNDENYKAVALCHQGRHKEGLAILKDDYKKFKNDPQYWNNLGTCYYLKGDPSKAEIYYRLGLASAVKQPNPMLENNLGVLYYQRGLYDEAYRQFKKSVGQDANILTSRFNLAVFYLRFGRWDEARDILVKLYKVNPADVDVLTTLATTYLYKNEIKNSLELFQKIPVEYRTRQDIAIFYALALYYKKDFANAEIVLGNMQNNKISELNDTLGQLKKMIEDGQQAMKERK